MYLSLLISLASAGEAEFTFVDRNQPAPFEGTLLNPQATAELLVLPDRLKAECDIEIEYQVDLLSTERELQISNLNSRYTALDLEYQQAVQTKDLQIENLETIISSNSGVSKWVWFASGIAAGTATTYVAYRAFNEQ
tara:strand:+ start:443 stop:853 length:411 start_codon:yes stop_codon:yes gene_type:complete